MAMGQREAIRWVANNDDCEEVLEDDSTPLTVTMVFVCDCYDIPEDVFRRRLKKAAGRLYDRE